MKKLIPIAIISIILTSCIDFKINKIQNPDPVFNSFLDSRDGYEYETVKLGDQTWMAENLRFLPSVSKSTEGSLTETHYYVYGYEGNDVAIAASQDNYNIYGVLYNYEAANIGCPTGWHLPSDDEWKTLEFVLGMDPGSAELTELRFAGDVGEKLKATTLWATDGGGDNASGFNALPGGDKDGVPKFSDITEYAIFWTSTPDGADQAYHRSLRYGIDGIYRDRFYRDNGFSVRCLKD